MVHPAGLSDRSAGCFFKYMVTQYIDIQLYDYQHGGSFCPTVLIGNALIDSRFGDHTIFVKNVYIYIVLK